MTTAGTWYPPAALQPSTYDPSAGTGGFLANPPFRPMADLIARTLLARHQVGDRAVLDWLEVARLATPTRPGGRAVGVTTRQLMELWACCQSTVSRRIAAINSAPPKAGLGRIGRFCWANSNTRHPQHYGYVIEGDAIRGWITGGWWGSTYLCSPHPARPGEAW